MDEREDADASDLDVFDEPTVSIPISFFSILNVTPARASPAAIEAAYAGVINRELVDGFSDGCLAARADLVDAAAQVLSDPDLRREHEDDVKNGRLTPVPASQLGGALALMQEAGEHESVIEYAPECLAAVSTSAPKGARRDITLSAALAHCELSHDALTAMPPRVGEGCELLDIASSILVAEAGPGFSVELQETINRTLQEMAPAYVIELLSMPLEAEKERKEGLRALRQILWGGSVDDVGSLNDRDAYVREVHRHLTSEEIVDLFLDAPSDSPADVDEIYNAAMAHVVCGYTQHRPSLLMDADEMFAQLEDAAWVAANEARDQYATMADAAARAGASPNFAQQPQAEQVTVERAVCQILMGRIEDAAYTLGLTQEQLAYGMADPQVERFVADNSPSGDMTEGLCAMADRWLADVAFPSFRDGARINPPPTTYEWFETPKVQRFCTRYDMNPGALKFAAGVENFGRGFGKLLEGVASSVGGSSVPGLRAGTDTLADADQVFSLKPKSRLMQYLVTNRRAGTAAVGVGVAVGGALIAAGAVSYVQGGTTAHSAVASSSSSSSSFASSPASLRGVAAKLGAGVANAGDVVVGKFFGGGSVPEVDAKVAEQVVRRWQHAKAQALGVAHNLKPLEQVLEGPMLQQWLTRAEDVRSHGWAWEYQLNSLSIDKVESLSETRAMVEATLTEVAILKDRARTEEDDRYESTYRARYELRRGEGRGGYRAWKIIGGSVVY